MKADKLNLRKSFFVGLLCMVVAGTSFTGCSKDDDDGDEPSGGDIAKIVAGTYKGKLNIGTEEYFNAILIATEAGGDKIKYAPKSGEAYSNATPKIMILQNPSGNPEDGILSQDATGSSGYIPSTKHLVVITNETDEGDISFAFDGTKQ